MKGTKTVFLIALILVLVMGGAYVLYGRLSAGIDTEPLTAQETEAPGETGETEELALAPDFTVYDALGEPVRLSDYAGTPVVLNFWASWCGPCKSEMPDFDAAWQELEGEVQFLMVNMTDGSRETVESASAYVAEQGYTFPVFFDTETEAALAYGAYSIPTTYFIDAEGYAVARGVGALSAEALDQGIGMILP